MPAHWEEERVEGDGTFYYAGVFQSATADVNVVAAAASEMGMAAASCLCMKMIHNYRPRYLAMGGITAGVGGAFGDVVVAEQSWDYGSGKITVSEANESIFAPAPSYLRIAPELREKVQYFLGQRRAIIAGIPARWKGTPADTPLKVHLGPMASGAAVVENESVVEEIRSHNRKLLAVEMETYGVYLAAHVCSEPRPSAFSAKAICDFGMPPKNDDYQRYAAFSSANFIYEFALDQLSVKRRSVAER